MSALPVSIRLNPFKGGAGPQGSPVPWSPHGRILPERPVFTLDPLFHAGCYYVQDSSAMFTGYMLRTLLPQTACGPSGPRVLDLCAAPGGKTTDASTILRESCGDAFRLVSNEVMKARVSVLADNVAVWGDSRVTVTSADPAAFSALEGYFDVIIADVPCSGEGMFRKDSRAVEEWSPAVVALCAERQRRILADAWPALKEGGLLIYSTCTYEEVENDGNLKWAAMELGGEIVPPQESFPEYGVRLTECGSLLRAGEVPGEGQWVGALFKTSRAGRCRNGDRLKALEYSGNKPKRASGVPDPNAPLAIDFDRTVYPEVELDRQTALKYLHRDALVLPEAAPGYNVVCFEGHPLGFVKNIGTRCNNLLPRSRKILMDI